MTFFQVYDVGSPTGNNSSVLFPFPLDSGQTYQIFYNKVGSVSANKIFNTSNPSEFYNETNADGNNGTYYYKTFIADTNQYSINNLTSHFYYVQVIGNYFALPLTFPVGSYSKTN